MQLLGVKYDNLSVDEALFEIFSLLEKMDKANVFFLNADCLYKAQKDQEYRSILNAAHLLLPDGIGLKLATRIFGGRMKENCNGTDLSPKVLEKAEQLGKSVFFMGGKEGVSAKAADNAKKSFPRLKIVGDASGYFSDTQSMIEKINNSGADILFVALGVPLQEKWIVNNRDRLRPKICFGVGAFLDYLSGTIPRAPSWMRKLHLEWFWRIFIDPKRMFKRYLIDGFCFVVFAIYRRVVCNEKSKIS
ncbi:MAG: WecB/TagA/CpsF family glycosyltransferase [Candidatus Omnitrophica bacterium]|nr:WecB/TagA/CpsF family glycosyltransferase [Candidatus Omnitrophota bacterium]